MLFANVQELQNFMQVVADVGIITSGSIVHVNLETIKTEYGHNFNTLIIKNNASEEISLTIDGRKVIFISGGGSAFVLDWKDGLLFDDLQITNEDGATDTSVNEIRITIGRTGIKNG